jgi:hypothetical protein
MRASHNRFVPYGVCKPYAHLANPECNHQSLRFFPESAPREGNSQIPFCYP